mmetsp:Transcript_12374/g.23446  ORF Transcript_12374/g.23446 Transcript_12374/m.23446 type:complete len:102 (-) Transcript_12374:1883-2188(-)
MEAEKKVARSVKRQLAAIKDKVPEAPIPHKKARWRDESQKLLKKEWMFPAFASILAVPLTRSVLVFPLVWVGYGVTLCIRTRFAAEEGEHQKIEENSLSND